MKKECDRYRRTKKQFAPFVKLRLSCNGNQDTTHLKELVTFVSYPGWIESIKSKQPANLPLLLIISGNKAYLNTGMDLKLDAVCISSYMQKIKMFL